MTRKVSKNISFLDFIRAYYNLFADTLQRIFLYMKIYKNFYYVMKKISKNDYPISAILRNGKNTEINNFTENLLIINNLEKYCRFEGKCLIIKKNLPPVIFLDWELNGDFIPIFFEEEYGFLPVKGREVIDIGANIADSAIYFALNGATRVIALEPFKKNYESAKKNIQKNGLDGIIDLIMAGCGGKIENIKLDPEKSGITSVIKISKNKGITVPVLTLDKILDLCKTDLPVLKIDCEGCEYDTILLASRETLQNFSHIQIEYHYGYQNLKKKLEQSGFNVRVNGPKAGRKLVIEKKAFRGILFAVKK